MRVWYGFQAKNTWIEKCGAHKVVELTGGVELSAGGEVRVAVGVTGASGEAVRSVDRVGHLINDRAVRGVDEQDTVVHVLNRHKPLGRAVREEVERVHVLLELGVGAEKRPAHRTIKMVCLCSTVA